MKNQPLDTLNGQDGSDKKEEHSKTDEAIDSGSSSIEQKKKEFLEKIEKFREKEKFYNEEKIRLNKLLETLREELGLIEQKEKTEEIETHINEETLPEEKKEEVIPVADTQEEVSEIIKTETGQEITVLKNPLQINVEKVIDANVSAEEKSEIQKAFPDENIWEVIKNQVTEQLNDKTITPIEKRGKFSKLKMIGKKNIKISIGGICHCKLISSNYFFQNRWRQRNTFL